MRWKPKPGPKYGAKRTKTFFTLLPVQSFLTKEWRWLEWIKAEEIYGELGWRTLRFIDEPQETDPKPL